MQPLSLGNNLWTVQIVCLLLSQPVHSDHRNEDFYFFFTSLCSKLVLLKVPLNILDLVVSELCQSTCGQAWWSGLIPRTHRVEVANHILQAVPWPPQAYRDVHTCTHTILNLLWNMDFINCTLPNFQITILLSSLIKMSL